MEAPALQVPQGHKDQQVLQEIMVLMEQPGLRDLRELTGQPAHKGQQVTE